MSIRNHKIELFVLLEHVKHELIVRVSHGFRKQRKIGFKLAFYGCTLIDSVLKRRIIWQAEFFVVLVVCPYVIVIWALLVHATGKFTF